MDGVVELLSAEHLSYLEERIRLGVWELRLRDNKLRWSSGLFRILGLNPKNAVPSFDLYRDIVHPEDRLDIENNPSLITAGALAHRKFRIIRPSGEMRWVESHGQVMLGSDGKATTVLGFALDVTETQAATTTQAAYEALLQAVRVLTGAQIWQTAPDGTIVDELNWWQSVDRAQTLGVHWSEQHVVHPDDVAAVSAAWADATARRSVYRATFRRKQPDGTYQPSTSVAVPVLDASGDPIGWIGSSKLSAIPTAERYLEVSEIPAALYRAARAILNSAADDFAAQAGVSHSTIRRIEGLHTEQVSAATRKQVADYLSRRGIRFTADSLGAAQMSLTAGPALPGPSRADDPEDLILG